ncbi:MAG: bifunctional 2-keto-4-hydroxyglutarate aldolase/2-keto-3-deoxy-6-phosphogluconate aldolase [Bacilli bacterium]|jgi:2-dehydro-3-deoxyphosphogluconate aldolase/(4S)-4-hydroxy-2-oxoglutarate aldolase|nr:bifunctional 2-keto-4-hydroxyglutarate aldolase/2-keto-3-deoxy-6-phosphogluconate aldolase [Bacilli bacterium]
MAFEKIKTLEKLTSNGVIAVIRGEDLEVAKKISAACVKGGIIGLEVTFTVPGADRLIKELSDHDDGSYIVGAGTVLDDATARIAILAGAKFIVSPSFDKATAELCNLYQIPYMAGCFTITEIITALKAGVDVIKVFPGSSAGPAYLKAVHGPLPQANLMPTGGVSEANAKDWIKAGAVALGTGGSLTEPAKTGNYEEITKRAAEFVRLVKEAREGK